MRILLAVVLALAAPAALAQAFPSKPIRIIVPFTPGSATDAMARQTPDMTERLAKLGAEPMSMSPEQLDAFLREEFSVLGEVIRASGVKAQ